MNTKLTLSLLLIFSTFGAFSQKKNKKKDSKFSCCTLPKVEVPEEFLKRPLFLKEGIGTVYDSIIGKKEAQIYYNQGMAYLHSYHWINAARSFYQAIEQDSNCAMAYIGLSRAYSGLEKLKEARMAANKANELGNKVSVKDQRRIKLRSLQLDAIDSISNLAKLEQYIKEVDKALQSDYKNVEL